MKDPSVARKKQLAITEGEEGAVEKKPAKSSRAKSKLREEGGD